MKELKCPKCNSDLLKSHATYKHIIEDYMLVYDEDENCIKEDYTKTLYVGNIKCSKCDESVEKVLKANNISIEYGIENTI